jgi:hypothetical protein
MGMNAMVGVFCLVALWCAALLVAGAALQDLRELLASHARLRALGEGELGEGFLVGEIVEGAGPDGALATHAIVQRGRALDGDAPAIAFRDVSYESRVHGGVVRAGDTRIVLDAGAARAAVWRDRRARQAAAASANGPAFSEVFTMACTARGHTRRVTTAITVGARVFVAGEVARRGDELVMRAAAGGELVVAEGNPRSVVARQLAAVAFFVAGELLVCAACTALALWPPVFGCVSTVGAAACLAFFLGVTPLGVWLRERCLPPSRAPLHGEWKAELGR